MSTDRDTTRIVRSWLRTEEHESADRVLEAVLDQLDTTPQRRVTWWPVRRFPVMSTTAKFTLGAAAVVVAAFLGIRFLLPGDVGLGGDPEPVPTPTPVQLPAGGGEPLDAGTYRLRSPFPVELTFELPAGWMSCSLGSLEQGVCVNLSPQDVEGGVGITFQIVENVVSDPCDETSLPDPAIGPSVDDLVTAISNLPGFEATPAEDVVVAGFRGKRFTVTAPAANPGCDLQVWATSSRVNGVGLGEVNLLYVIDVHGVRVMISSAYFPDQVREEDLAAAEEVIASIEIEP